MDNERPMQAGAAPLSFVLRQLAQDIAAAQRTLDAYAEDALGEAMLADDALPPLAYYFPEVELDVSIAFSLSQFQGTTTLTVAPANPTSSSFFRAASFSSRLRVRVAPRAALVPSLDGDGDTTQ